MGDTEFISWERPDLKISLDTYVERYICQNKSNFNFLTAVKSLRGTLYRQSIDCGSSTTGSTNCVHKMITCGKHPSLSLSNLTVEDYLYDPPRFTSKTEHTVETRRQTDGETSRIVRRGDQSERTYTAKVNTLCRTRRFLVWFL